MKRISHIITLFIIMLITMISLVMVSPVQQIQAAEKPGDLSQTYLNVICKYLYLGSTDKNKFDFNINDNVLPEGATYRWIIVQDKGAPKAITIDSKTGIVKAKSVGTAYIRCEITLADKSVLLPEASVIVINNITGVTISNIPDNKLIRIDTPMDFNQRIMNTTAGKKVMYSGITRWEIANDTAGVGNATDDGIVTPQKVGEFSIRAVCFQSVQDYETWLVNKTSKHNYITAASDWVTLTTISSERVATTQEQLNELLTMKNITQITLATDAELKIVIPVGDYSDRTLVVNAPNTDIVNNGVFKLITINSAYNSVWEENAVNNSLVINNSMMSLLISDKSQVQSVTFGKVDTSTIKTYTKEQRLAMYKHDPFQKFAVDKDYVPDNLTIVTVKGKLAKLDITTISSIDLSGLGEVDQIILEETADGTKLVTSVGTALKADCDFILTLLDGSEKIKNDIALNINARIENLTTYGMIPMEYWSTGYRIIAPNQALELSANGFTDSFNNLVKSKVIKLTPYAISFVSTTPAVTATPVIEGLTLMNSVLKGSFNYNTVKIDGVLSWYLPNTVMNAAGNYMWIFTPIDSDHYNCVYGTINVDIVAK